MNIQLAAVPCTIRTIGNIRLFLDIVDISSEIKLKSTLISEEISTLMSLISEEIYIYYTSSSSVHCLFLPTENKNSTNSLAQLEPIILVLGDNNLLETL